VIKGLCALTGRNLRNRLVLACGNWHIASENLRLSVAVTMRYPIAAPDLSGNELAYVTDCLHSTWISSAGDYVGEFETRMAALSGRRHGVATCNGTAALHLALLALQLKPGDEVIVPTLTFVATANAVTYCGATPVFADCDPDTWCLDPDSVARLVSPRTRGIILVHLYGHPCDMDALTVIADAHGLWVLEDAAEAIGAQYRGRPVGSLGVAGVFSFFGNKTLTTGEGGMIVTGSDELAERMRHLRGQGMDPEQRYWHTAVGYNYRMTNIAAAIGTAQLERVNHLVSSRRQVAEWYQERLVSNRALTLPVEHPKVHHGWWMYSVLLDRAGCRAALMADLAAHGIETRPVFYPVHHFPMYEHHPTDGGCPIACGVSARGLTLPTASYLKEADVDFIAGQLGSLTAGLPAWVA
jgi:perosamine synthetase